MRYNFVCIHYPENTHTSNVCAAVSKECGDNVEVCREARKIVRHVSSVLGHPFSELSVAIFSQDEAELAVYFGTAEVEFIRNGLIETKLYNEYNELEEFVAYHEAIN